LISKAQSREKFLVIQGKQIKRKVTFSRSQQQQKKQTENFFPCQHKTEEGVSVKEIELLASLSFFENSILNFD